jgi:hypothetical protein
MSKHRFHTDQIADVSTSEITERDCELIMDPRVPHHLANHDKGFGAIIYTQDDPKQLTASLRSLRGAGFSRVFCKLFRAASISGIRYIRFDADGERLKTRCKRRTSQPDG